MNIPDQPMAAPHQIHTYTALRHQIHDDLRIQHPERVQSNGESPCVILTRRVLWNLLDFFTRTGSTNLSLRFIASLKRD